MKASSIIFTAMFIIVFSGSLSGQNSVPGTNASAADVIAAIIKNTGAPSIPNTVDIIKEGDPEMKLTNVKFAAGAPGSLNHIGLLEDKNTDVVLAGESPPWETYEYMRDAVDQGRKKAIVFLGHISTEEAGMDYCATWLKTFIKNVPISFVESGPSFWSY